MAATAGHGGRSGQGAVEGRCLCPLIGFRVIGHAVVVGLLGFGVETAEQVELRSERSVLHCGTGLHAGSSGHVGQRFPRLAARVFQPESFGAPLSVGLSAGHVDVAVAVGSGHLVQSHGQRRHFSGEYLAVGRGRQQPRGLFARFTVGRTAQTHHSVRHADAHTVGQRFRQLSGERPYVVQQGVDVLVKHLCAAFGSRGVGEVAAAGHDGSAAYRSAIGGAHALRPVHLERSLRGDDNIIKTLFCSCTVGHGANEEEK